MAEERVNYDDIEDEVNNLKDIAQRLEETNQKKSLYIYYYCLNY